MMLLSSLVAADRFKRSSVNFTGFGHSPVAICAICVRQWAAVSGSVREGAAVSGSERQWAAVSGSERQWAAVSVSERQWAAVSGSVRGEAWIVVGVSADSRGNEPENQQENDKNHSTLHHLTYHFPHHLSEERIKLWGVPRALTEVVLA